MTSYAGALTAYLDWLEQVAAGDWRDELTELPAGEVDLFDHATGDTWLALQSRD